jgi:UDP-glucose 4-epimerase
MRILVTGGAGFVGSHLNDVLLARGVTVVAVDDLSKGTIENLEHNTENAQFEFHEFDIRDIERLTAVAGPVDCVVHLAAAKIPRYENTVDSVALNFDGARAALEVARQAGAKAVLASTSDVYGKSDAVPFREDADLVLGASTSRRWAYAISKLCDEHLAFAYQDEHGVPVTLLRFFGAYGERQYLSWWGGPQGVFLDAIANGREIEIHGDGLQTRCFIHVDDLVEAVARAVERPEANGQILNVGTTEEVTIRGLAELMFRLSGLPGSLQARHVSYESFTANYEDVRRRIPDLTKMRRILGYEPRVSLEDGLGRLWAWYRRDRRT